MSNFWCYRIDKNRIDFFQNELKRGVLRQGWGYDEKQNLKNLKMDGGAKRNLPMFHKVKKDDILLIPRLPKWNLVTIVQASEDWDTAYQFDKNNEFNDYGHMFPAKILKC
jgi:hypothetical protein